MLNSMTVKSKIILSLIVSCLVSIMVIGFLGYSIGKDALKESTFQKLTALRSAKTMQVEDYFSQIRKQMKTFSENRMVVDAMKNFKPAFHGILDEVLIEPSELKKYEQSVRGYYQSEFLPRLHKNLEADRRRGVDAYWSNDSKVTYLQYKYISGNDNEVGSKHMLDYANDKTTYADLHKLYHPVIRSYLEEFGYYDIFLVDHETGHIVYSVFKEADYGTSLTTGPYRNTNFAEVMKAAASASDKDFIKLVDFRNYEPSYDAPASFIASPIYDGDKKLGVAVFQMPIDSINRITTGGEKWQQDGLGKTGQTKIVGSDGKMKSMSRTLIEDPDKFIADLGNVGIDEKVINKIDKLGTTIGLLDVSTEATKSALSGKSDTIINTNYNGSSVLSSFSPLKIEDVSWAIVSEIEEEEALASVDSLSNNIMFWGGVIIALSLVLSVLMGKSITAPIAKSADTLKDISQGEGDLTARFHLREDSNDHTDRLANYFNQFIETIHKIIGDVKQVSDKLEDASTKGGDIASKLNDTAISLKSQSESSSASITQINSSLDSVSASGEEISNLMKNVSAAVTQMAATTKEMASQCSSSATQARDANTKSQESGVVMKQLTEAAEKIGAVVDTISDIADKTDLLALNATIEAASAGEAGKGFAVVATEIKELSKQTQGATGEISSLIDGIRGSAKDASFSSEEVSKIITNLNTTVEGIAAGVEEMAATAQEVDSNVSSAASGADQIANNIKDVSKGALGVRDNIMELKKYAESTEENAGLSNTTAETLNELSNLLRGQVSRFKV
jgi:methyl-accepting chemotaxis protein